MLGLGCLLEVVLQFESVALASQLELELEGLELPLPLVEAVE